MTTRRVSSLQKASPIAVKSTNDGIHLSGSILWLDSRASGDLSFLSSALTPVQAKMPQLITTEETTKILETTGRRPHALVCQYNRPFSIGHLKLELLPSGVILGGSSLHIETDKGRILYAPSVQTQRIPTVRKLQLKKADVLIIGASHEPAATMPNRKKEKERLVEVVKKYVAEKKFPIIFCQAIGTAQELTGLLSEHDIPLAVHAKIFKANKIYGHYGSDLGRYCAYSPKYTRQKVVMLPFSGGRATIGLRKPIPEGPVIYVEDTLAKSSGPEALRDVDARFYISSSSDGANLKEVIEAVNPRELFVFGPYAKAYAEHLKGLCPKVKPLYQNDQPTLF